MVRSSKTICILNELKTFGKDCELKHFPPHFNIIKFDE